ncbi:MAG: ligase ATP-dependent (dnl1) [Acidobacteriales bacterium]|nr:ligase ATP-dependent (dnl1) [Terriglobales bacterium]
MKQLADLCESVSRTTKKTEKIALVADYFQNHAPTDSANAAVFLSGRAFPAYEETTLNVGGALLARVIVEVTHANDHQLGLAYRRHGDLGSAAFDLFTEKFAGTQRDRVEITLPELESKFRDIASASGPAKKSALIGDLFQRASPLEAKYLVKFMGGDLRIGLRESLVEEATAKAYAEDATQVRRANMLLGDIAATLLLAADHRLTEAHMRLFHPIGLMLATPIENSTDAFAYLKETPFQIEDKYDGIRAQIHIGPDPETCDTRVRIFSRTMDDITESFPELAESFRDFPQPVILDGEILAWDINSARSEPLANGLATLGKPETGNEKPFSGRALPFTRLQPRLGRKFPTAQLMRDFPLAYVAFDVLYANDNLVIEKSLRERNKLLDRLFATAPQPRGSYFLPTPQPTIKARKAPPRSTQQHLFAPSQHDHLVAVAEPENSVPLPPLLRAPIYSASTPEELDSLFDAAQACGNEGLMLKALDSPYTPGRRGKSWLKLKRELATLDVVVTAVEFGHGKRAAVLSDYTFAVRDTSPHPEPNSDAGRLLNVGKAYSGLTDVEIANLTTWFMQHTIEDQGHRRLVEPRIVLEVAFNNVMESDRHESGYALRFPRILRLRPDKPVSEIDTLARVREIFERQHSTRSNQDDAA